jgi:hypothetical protein
VSTAHATDVATRFLDALAQRDFASLAAAFADDAVLRGLVPSRLREEHGSVAIGERFRFWFGDTVEFRLVDSDIEELADVVRIRWRVSGVDPELGTCVTEQTAYAELGAHGIAWMNLVCSGDRPLPA